MTAVLLAAVPAAAQLQSFQLLDRRQLAVRVEGSDRAEVTRRIAAFLDQARQMLHRTYPDLTGELVFDARITDDGDFEKITVVRATAIDSALQRSMVYTLKHGDHGSLSIPGQWVDVRYVCTLKAKTGQLLPWQYTAADTCWDPPGDPFPESDPPLWGHGEKVLFYLEPTYRRNGTGPNGIEVDDEWRVVADRIARNACQRNARWEHVDSAATGALVRLLVKPDSVEAPLPALPDEVRTTTEPDAATYLVAFHQYHRWVLGKWSTFNLRDPDEGPVDAEYGPRMSGVNGVRIPTKDVKRDMSVSVYDLRQRRWLGHFEVSDRDYTVAGCVAQLVDMAFWDLRNIGH